MLLHPQFQHYLLIIYIWGCTTLLSRIEQLNVALKDEETALKYTHTADTACCSIIRLRGLM